jgi:hypothetical protein
VKRIPHLAALLTGGALLLTGCSPTAIVTAPIKAAAKATDWATVSGDEADRERGRVLRKKCRERYDRYYCEK